jgi:hypothetical protein
MRRKFHLGPRISSYTKPRRKEMCMNIMLARVEERAEVAASIDPRTATVFFLHTPVVDPYGDLSDEELRSDDPDGPPYSCVGRSYFACGPDGKAVHFGDLPDATLDALWNELMESFPGGWEHIVPIAGDERSSDTSAHEMPHIESSATVERRAAERLARSPVRDAIAAWIEALTPHDVAWINGVASRRLADLIGVSEADLYAAWAKRAALDPACQVVKRRT